MSQINAETLRSLGIEKLFYTTDEASKILGETIFPPDRIRRMCREGVIKVAPRELTGTKSYAISRDALLEFYERIIQMRA
ncbi:MAG: helix-turn-helix domain-containing protein [Selenomonadaceae bacterium]